MNTPKSVKRLSALCAAVVAVAMLWLALSAGGDAQTATAQTADTPTPVPTQQQGDEFGNQQLPAIQGKLNPPRYPNMDSSLNQIVEQAQSGGVSANIAAANAPLNSGASVAVTLYITEGYAQDVWGWLEDNGADPRNIGVDYIEAYIPVPLLPAASQQSGVISVRTIIPPQPAQGDVVSDGVAAHGVPAWHADGIKGSGVKIGIIDIGFKGFAELMGTELPSSVEARCHTDVGVFTANLTDCIPTESTESSKVHGTAVTEAAFDIAPEADYYIANVGSLGDLRETVDWMASEGVDVINMSLGFGFHGPGDGTTPYSASSLVTVEAAVRGGIIWVNAAGNSARANWFGQYSDTNANSVHGFGVTNDECNGVIIQLDPFEGFTAHLRWEDFWGGASSDLDLYLIPITPSPTFSWSSAVAKSEDMQSGGANHVPSEIIRVEHGDIPDGLYCLAVRRAGGAAPNWVQLLVWGAASSLQHHTFEHSIGNPAESANRGLLAVGATSAFDINTIEFYSSQGPTLDRRIKPDIVGVARGQSVSYRSADSPDGRWAGTSQSSPHVAGLAALVKQRNPNYSPSQIADYLKQQAEERGAAGNDNVWGYGFAKLSETVHALATPVTPQSTEEVLNRISALDTLVSSLQSLIASLQSTIAALDGRLTALEASASPPTPISTPTLTATPTLVPGAPTPTPSATPTITPTVAADACVTHISADGAISGSWTSACLSTNRPLHPRKPDDGTYHAQYYSFDISASSSVTITLESSEDTYLYLLDGKGKTGSVVAENDDITPHDNLNSRIVETLQAGSYTIEAATYDSGITGGFTVTVSGIQ